MTQRHGFARTRSRTELSPAGIQVGGGVTGSDWSVGVSAVHADPAYDGAGFTGGDTAIFILSSDAPVTPLRWLRAGSAAAALVADGAAFESVGFGLANAPSGPDTSGTKRHVALTITSSTAADFRYGSAQKNSCSGDSGGPAIADFEGEPIVIGVTSWGDDNCNQFGVDVRTDASDAFLAQYAASTGVGAGGAPGGSPTPAPTATPGGDPGNPVAGGGSHRSLGYSVADLREGPAGAILGLLLLACVSKRRMVKARG